MPMLYNFEGHRVSIKETKVIPDTIGGEIYGDEFYILDNNVVIRKIYFDQHAAPVEAEQTELF